MATETHKLRVELEATTAKFIAGMKRAQNQGAITGRELETVLARANASVANQSKKAADGMRGLTNISRQGRFVLGNTANQIGDIAVQLEGGTSAMKVMGQQMPQILGGFGALGGALGVLGPLLGTVAAVGFPVAAMLLAQGDGAKEAAPKVKSFADQMQIAEAAMQRAADAARLASAGGLDDLKKSYGEVTDEVSRLVDRLSDIERLAAAKGLKDLAKGLDTSVLASELAKMETGSDFATARIALEVPPEEVERVKLLIQQLQDALVARPGDAGLETSLRLAREQLALYLGDLENAGQLAGNVKFDNESLLRTVELAKQIPEAIAEDRFAAASGMMAELLDLMEALGIETAEGFGAEVVQIESQLRKHVALLGDAESGAAGTAAAASEIAPEISNANAEAAALVGNLRAAMSALASVTAGIAAAQRKAIVVAKIKLNTVGQPIDRAEQLATVDFNEKSGSAAYAAIRTGNTAALGEIAAMTSQIADGAREVVIAERKLEEAEKVYADSIRVKRGGGGKKGKQGGRSSKKEFGSDELMAKAQGDLEKMQRQIEMIGKTDEQIAALTLKYKLLDEAKRRGVDLDRQNATTGETVRQSIDRQAEAMAGLTQKYDDAKSRQEALTALNQQFEDTVISAFDGGSDAVQNFLNWLKKAAAQYALFGSGPLAGMFGGGGGLLGGSLGKILSFDGGGHTGGGSRSGGVDGRGGFPAILHPNETVIDHTKRGGSFGGGSSVEIHNYSGQPVTKEVKTLPGGGRHEKVTVGSAVAAAIGTPGNPANRSLRQRGLVPPLTGH